MLKLSLIVSHPQFLRCSSEQEGLLTQMICLAPSEVSCVVPPSVRVPSSGLLLVRGAEPRAGSGSARPAAPPGCCCRGQTGFHPDPGTHLPSPTQSGQPAFLNFSALGAPILWASTSQANLIYKQGRDPFIQARRLSHPPGGKSRAHNDLVLGEDDRGRWSLIFC